MIILYSLQQCFENLTLSLDLDSLFSSNVSYNDQCDLDPESILTVEFQIQRTDFELKCDYSDVKLEQTVEMNCDCEETDGECNKFKNKLQEQAENTNKENFVQGVVDSFNYTVKILLNDQVYTVVVEKKHEYVKLYYYIIIPIAGIIIIVCIVNGVKKCRNKKNKMNGNVTEIIQPNTPNRSTPRSTCEIGTAL
ncbi:Hypothetical_protein [Hexamita inflata]|uniref:Hypothetical_protein n=1 Tax=Hexamita inflata TaxID=28002 RepID=A0AA86NVH4_9EUKA|nr:Hypothetical protein HINF_LOCUS14620 [Hexamita inflata]